MATANVAPRKISGFWNVAPRAGGVAATPPGAMTAGATNAIGARTATLNWSGVPSDASHVRISFREMGAAAYTTTLVAKSPASLVMTGLLPDRQYQRFFNAYSNAGDGPATSVETFRTANEIAGGGEMPDPSVPGVVGVAATATLAAMTAVATGTVIAPPVGLSGAAMLDAMTGAAALSVTGAGAGISALATLNPMVGVGILTVGRATYTPRVALRVPPDGAVR